MEGMAEDVLGAVKLLVREGNWSLDPHAQRRMKERSITIPEVQYVLETGYREEKKDTCQTYASSGIKEMRYAIRGPTIDQRELRVVIVLEDGLWVVTVIDLSASPDNDS